MACREFYSEMLGVVRILYGLWSDQNLRLVMRYCLDGFVDVPFVGIQILVIQQVGFGKTGNTLISL